ncbi:Adaptor protein complex 4 (AP-4); beta subunit [Paratrimastix pyriformis]|uniref:Adaptor protein complex 4 (AP-4) n=1 Tax=Paratrimastix pyriformis TaxID=342808 RepID=A0ABQ8UIF9_9EUKA|nr:Adaptor protein complex 4 (AP-4); beta subunit [Paratrimastix pyriformis]
MAAPAPKPDQGAYFADRKGEVNELRALIRNPIVEHDPAKKREVIKRVTTYMTQGIDMSGLFSDMVMSVVSKDFTVKKLVYQYLCYYATVQEDLTILVINTLRRDCKNENPMVRGLALRSLSSLRVSSVVEYLVPHITAGLTDASSYVRSAAVNACIKLFHISPATFKENNLVDTLYEMIRDRDATVAGNCVAALNEILAGDGGIQINRPLVTYMLNRLGEFNEWHAMRVLELLQGYAPQSEEELYDIMNLLEDRFRHAHSGVMFGVAAVFLKFARPHARLHEDVCRRIVDPLVTFLSTSPPEIAYVCLAHARAMQERFPGLFDTAYRTFYFRIFDPLYVKLEKLEMLVLVANEANAAHIVAEVGEYCTEMDVSRQAIRALGRIALRVGKALDQVVGLLQELLAYEVASFAQVIVVVIQDLLRKYPGSYEKFLPILGRHLYAFDTAEAKEALIWILGEFGEYIPATPYLLEQLIEKVSTQSAAPPDDPTAGGRAKRESELKSIKFQLLTAATKLLFKRGPEMQQILGPFLGALINDCQQADLRDRALLIYRTLSCSARQPNDDGLLELAHNVFLAPKSASGVFTEEMTSEFKERIFDEFNSCSVLLRQPASHFIKTVPIRLSQIEAQATPANTESGVLDPYSPDEATRGAGGDLLNIGGAVATAAPAAPLVSLEPNPERLTPPQFQAAWSGAPYGETLELAMRAVPTQTDLQQAIAQSSGPTHELGSLLCLAVGAVGPVVKGFLYARSGPKLLLGEVQANGAAMQLLVKIKLAGGAGDHTDQPTVRAFGAIVQQALGRFL